MMPRFSRVRPSVSFLSSSWLPIVLAAVASSRTSSSNRRMTRTTLPSYKLHEFMISWNLLPSSHASTTSMSCGLTLPTYSSSSRGILHSIITSPTFLAMPRMVSKALCNSGLLVMGSSLFSSKTKHEHKAMIWFACMSAKTFWKTISVINTSSAEVSSQAILPLSCTTPSLSMNSSLRSTRRMPRKSSVITMNWLLLICFSNSCTFVCILTFRSKVDMYAATLAFPCNGLCASFPSKSAMPARAASRFSPVMCMSETGFNSGRPVVLKRLWFLIVDSVLSSVRRTSSVFGLPSGMCDRMLLIFHTSFKGMGKIWPSDLGPVGGTGLCFSMEPGSQGTKTSRTHCESALSPSGSSACVATLRRPAAMRIAHPQSTSPSFMYTRRPGLRNRAMLSGAMTICLRSSCFLSLSFVR
mmetsp:Transcript_126762/g.354967  ORF Transcript_126762/g.354967 Transcript_126762/m.354967 type:complete len:412 (+) Transcript_126762:63-1298(+)